MRLEFEPNTSALPFVENEVVQQNVSSEVERMLREGVKAAQEGNRTEARNLLLRVTETDADNENAWLWLASISEYPEELLVFLNNVLRVNPRNERALEWHKATKSLLAKTLVQRGADAFKDDRREFARQCFEQALEHESENEMAWLWMASVADSDDEKTACFEKVLSVNPDNETAQVSLSSIQSQKTDKLFHDALSAAFAGRHDEAKEMLEGVLSRDSRFEAAWVLKSHLAVSFEERAECFLKLRVLNPENEMAKANLASWRELADRLAEQSDKDEVSPEFHEREAENETVSADFLSNAPAAEDLSAESEAQEEEEHQAENQHSEEYALPDSPTQDLSFDSYLQQPETAGFADEESAATEAPAEVNYAEEFQDPPLRLEAEENQADAAGSANAPRDLAAELAAEEAEMHWAFADPDENRESDDYFPKFAVADDVHQTKPANFEAENYTPEEQEENAADLSGASEAFAETAENSVETNAETEEDEEWRNTSPSVFVNYSPAPPEDPFEAKTVEFSQTAPAEENAAELFAPVAEDPKPQQEFPLSKSEFALCPFCNAENEKQAFSCAACHTVLTLSDLEMLLNQQNADDEKLRQAVQSLERENESYGLNAEQMSSLGIGHVNLKNYRQGFCYLQEAVRMNPSNVLLDAQVNALAIRLSEMEQQQSAHDSMPKNRKILVVDDSPTVRKLISGKLEKCGHEVICAVDGVDALEKINELMPDLVLLDITMPRMDGYQVCKLIRSNDATKNVPVVMISGKDGFFDKVRGRMAGTTGYITKPFGPETLMKTVETYLN